MHPNGDREPNGLDPPTSNLHPMLLMRKRNGWICTDRAMPPHPTFHIKAMKGKEEEEEDNEEKWVDGDKRNGGGNTRAVSSSSVQTAARLLLPPLSSFRQGERALLFKKKKREESGAEVVTIAKEPRDGVDGDGKKKGSGNNTSSGGGGGVVMEGSRCSRVNGRGWRCSQQTLVGYALCEHHLGKGRLRSMSSVHRNRSPAATTLEDNGTDSNGEGMLSLSFKLVKEDVLEDEDEKPHLSALTPENVKKKRKKIGTVKARSINSLLDQTHHAT